MLSFYPFFQQMGDGNKFKRTQSWRKILKKKDKKEKMKEREEGKLDGANSGSDSSISQTSTTSSASIGGKRTNGKGMVLISSLFHDRKLHKSGHVAEHSLHGIAGSIRLKLSHTFCFDLGSVYMKAGLTS